MYSITHIDQVTGLRRLTFANQGRNHYETFSAASDHLLAFLDNGTLRSNVLHEDAGTLEVRATQCYAHGDATGCFFEMKFRQLRTVAHIYGERWSDGLMCCRCGAALTLDDWWDTTSTKEPKSCYCLTCARPVLEMQRAIGEIHV